MEPITIVLDHPARHLWHRFWRWVSGMLGSLLLAIGLLASIPAVPTSLAVVSFVIGWLTTEPTDPDAWPEPDVPVREIVIAWAIATPIAIGGMRGGLRLTRRNRRLVVFLRRFGHDEAQAAVTFAVVRTIGASWRVVTLDDAEMAPVGLPVATTRMFGIGRTMAKQLIGIMHFLGLRMFPILTSAAWGVVALALVGPALDLAWTRTTSPEPWVTAAEPFVEIMGSVFEGKPPVEYLGLTLPGVFALLAMAAAVSFAVMMVSGAALILTLPLSTVLFFLSSSADAVRDAEKAAKPAVNTLIELRVSVRDIARRSARVFGPRLVVLRVASAVWQDAVRELAAVAAVPLIDISEPTDNVVWEIDELLQRYGAACIFIGHHERLLQLAASPPARALTPAESGVLERLAGREVLAYTTDPHGLRRFARALRGTLLTRQSD